LSVTCGLGYVTTAPHWFGSFGLLVMLAGQVIVGGCVSVTVTVKLQLAWLFDASVAVQFTVVVPNGNCELEAGVQLKLAPGQLSLTVGRNVTVATTELGSVPAVIFDGHAIEGGCVSLIVTVKLQVASLVEASRAVHVTVVVPTGNSVPEAGEQLVVTPGQLSAAVGEV
jgi:hypothetical protein